MAIIAPVLRFQSHDVAITLLLFFCVCVLAWVKINNPKRIPNLVTGFLKGGITEETTVSPDSIALFFVFIISIVILIVQGLKEHGVKIKAGEGEEFLLLGVALFVWYVLKTIAILLCGFIFRVQNDAWDYICEIYVFTHLTGIILLPIAILSTYAGNINENILEKCIICAFGLLLSYRTIKMLILMTSRGLNVIYLFLYLCVLEVSPLILAYEYCRGLNF